MSHPFIYYIPAAQTATPADLEEHGITALSGVSCSKIHTGRGPDMGAGVLVVPEHPGNTAAMADLKWQKCAGGKFWLGWKPDSMPTAKTLEKAEPMDGHLVALENGETWNIPIARRYPAGTTLPSGLFVDDTGAWKASPLPRYAGLVKAADRVFEAFLLETGQLSVAEMAEIAVQALAVNYHIDRHEASALGILSTVNVQHILGALIDLPTVITELDDKKKASDSNSSGFGIRD